MPTLTSVIDEGASMRGREELEAHLLRCTANQRFAFWRAVDLYYVRRPNRRQADADDRTKALPATAS